MPTYTFFNETQHVAWVRLYNPLSYIARTHVYDPYRANFTVDANTHQSYVDEAIEVVFKAVLLGVADLASGNVSSNKRVGFTAAQWQNAGIAIHIDIDKIHNAVRLA